MGEFDDIIPEFLTESTELLETVEKGLLGLEQGQAEDEMVHTVFRAIHSIKGGAGFVGLTKIERLAHRMEDLLNLIRNHDLVATPPITDALLQALDVLSSLFERVDEHSEIDIEGPIQVLQEALNAGVEPQVKQEMQAVSQPPAHTGLPGFEVSDYVLRNKFNQGNVFFIHLNLSAIEARGLTPIQLVNEMLSMGEILDANLVLPRFEQSGADEQAYDSIEVSFDVLYATVLEGDLLSAALRLDDGDYRQVSAEDLGLRAAGRSPAQAVPAAQAPSAGPRREAAPAREAQSVATPAPPAPTAPAPAPVAAETAPPEAGQKSGEYLTFTLGSESYGVDILSVQEIIGLPQLTRLPRCPGHVLGVMNLRGMVVPVVDLRRRLGLPPDESSSPVVVVLHVGDKIMGAVVDGVSDVVHLSESQVQEPPEFAGAVRREYLRGLSRHDQDMLILLELDRLLAPENAGYAA